MDYSRPFCVLGIRCKDSQAGGGGKGDRQLGILPVVEKFCPAGDTVSFGPILDLNGSSFFWVSEIDILNRIFISVRRTSMRCRGIVSSCYIVDVPNADE